MGISALDIKEEESLLRGAYSLIGSGPDSEKDPYEVKLAREIFQKYGSKQSSCDFVFDLHNTTSNMGATLILPTVDDPLEMHMANYLQSNCVDDSIPCHVFVCELPGKDTPYLQNIGKHCLSKQLFSTDGCFFKPLRWARWR
ncbi:hypothetical protein FKM82_026417 [Ascaphus truei]